MSRNYKEILLKELSARMPYRTKIQLTEYSDLTGEKLPNKIKILDYYILGRVQAYCKGFRKDEIKPYLYPLSSMTEEQCEEFRQVSGLDADLDSIRQGRVSLIGDIAIDCLYDAIDWFNKNHFDYRELIPLGLAIDATGLGIYDR